DGLLDGHEAEPVTRAEAQRSDRVRAALHRREGETHRQPLEPARCETGVHEPARLPDAHVRGLDALGQKEAHVEPRQWHGLAVRDTHRRDERLARDEAVRRDFYARLQRDERETRRERDQQPHHETAGGKHDERGHATDRRDYYEKENDGPLEAAAACHRTLAQPMTRRRRSAALALSSLLATPAASSRKGEPSTGRLGANARRGPTPPASRRVIPRRVILLRVRPLRQGPAFE